MKKELLFDRYKIWSPVGRTFLVTILAVAAFLSLPAGNSNQFKSFAEYGEGSGCSAAGRAGVCWDRVTHGCGTYYDSGNYCPGDDSVQCCVNSQVRCNTYTSSYCHNASAAGFGNAYNCGSVGGTFNSGGYCPGPWDVQCCVVPQQPPPTSVNASCNASSVVTVSWTLPGGYSWAYPRIYDETNGATCYPGPMTGSSYSCQGVANHEYSYWVHTTNSIGEPYSYEVPTARTVKFTCNPPTPTPTPTRTPTPTPTPPACPNNPAPNGTIISTGVTVTASNVRNGNTATYGPQNANDGVIDTTEYWDSGGSAPQWIEFNLGAPQNVATVQVSAHTGTGSVTLHTDQIRVGTTTNPSTVATSMNCGVTDGQVLNFPVNQANVQYVRLYTSASGSPVAWNEVSIYGDAPGSQTTTPGLIFSGNGSAGFGQGSASVTNWVVGGLTYPEVYRSTTHKSYTSYQYVEERANIGQAPIRDITTLTGCTLNNCTLPGNLASGVYRANGNLTLNGYSFPVNRNYVFLIKGDLTLMGNIFVPNGSTAFFTSSNNIIVDRNVGTPTNLFPLPSGQLQGIYSADRDFRIMGINSCTTGPDKMLNVEGAIVTNAGGQGGNFRIQRDLCGDNPKYPGFTIRARLDMLLNLPVLLLKRSTTFREDAP